MAVFNAYCRASARRILLNARFHEAKALLEDLASTFKTKFESVDRVDKLEVTPARPNLGPDNPNAATLRPSALSCDTVARAWSHTRLRPLCYLMTRGGYLAPAEFVREVIKNLTPYSPIRQAARLGQTSSGEVKIPRRTGNLTASWVGEVETRPATEPTYGQVSIPIDEAACYVDISNQMLEDSAVDMAAELAQDLGEEFGRL
jgi:HK97 family phage major capsid protein